MKILIDKIVISLSLTLLLGCTTPPETPPSQNKALNSISDSNGKDKKYFLQKQIDTFLEDEWEPTMAKDEAIQAKYGSQTESKSSFTLQEMADKQAAYKKAHPSDHSKSNVTRLNSMPVIGGSSRKR